MRAPRTKDSLPGFREEILAGIMRGLAEHLGRAGVHYIQESRSKIRVSFKGAAFIVSVSAQRRIKVDEV